MPEHRPDRAMGLMVIAMLILPGIDALAKALGDTLTSTQITWSRFFFQSLLMLPLALRASLPLFGPSIPTHALRGILLGVATALFFHALKYLAIADAIAIFFIEPLVLTALSALLLGESVGWRRISAVLVGFSGALIVIRPSFQEVGWPALLPVGAAVCFAFYIVLTRRAATHEEPAQMQFLSGLFGCGFTTLLLGIGAWAEIPVMTPVWPTITEWGGLFALGAIATTGHMLVVYALKYANASVLAPFQYLELVSATLLGWWFFADFPDAATLTGAAIIVSSGLYVFHRERVLGA